MDPAKLCYEDVIVGATQTVGDYLVTREAVLTFATEFDPQPFHLDDEAAAKTHFGRIAASGWHTAAISMRIMVDHVLSQSNSLGGAGLEDLRWVRPVYPGDRLSCRATVLEKRRSSSKPGLGIVRSQVETLNQHGDVVQVYRSTGMLAVRDPDSPIA